MARPILLRIVILVATNNAAVAQIPQPTAILLEARAQLPRIATSVDRWAATRAVGEWLARAGAYDEAIATTASDTLYLKLAYTDLARIRARNGDLSGALQMVATIQHDPDSARSVSNIAADLADAGQIEDAFRVAHGLRGRAIHDVELAVAGWLTEHGRLTEAEKMLDSAEATGAFADVERAALAEAYFRIGKRADAARLDRSVKDRESAPDFQSVRYDLAVGQRDWSDARALVLRGPLGERAAGLEGLAAAMARVGDTSAARRTLDEATTEATKIRDRTARLTALSRVAVTQRRLGIPVTAAKRMTVPDLRRSPEKGSRNCALVSAFGAAGLMKEARAIDSLVHCGARYIASYQFDAGDIDGALKTINDISDPANISATVSEWAARAAKDGRLTDALTVFRTLHVTHSYDDGYMSPAAAAIAKEMARRGDVTSALEWARSLETADLRAAGLTGVAQAVIAAQNPKAAEPLFPR